MKITQLLFLSSTSSQFLKRSYYPAFIMTTRSRVSKRQLASSSSSSSAKSKSSTKGPASKKQAKAKHKPAASSKNDDTSNRPWHHFYTKGDAEYEAYMTNEWGFETHGDNALFEKVSLEGAQSGLSWLTILRKREAYRRTFHNFDPVAVAAMTAADVEAILAQQTESTCDMVVRHRGKIESVINNAKCILEMRDEEPKKKDVFDKFLWSFVDHKPILNRCSEQRSTSPESEAMSKALKKRGFKFVGPTTMYAMMQALGMVMDHPVDSPEWKLAYQRLQARPGGYQKRTY